MNANTIGMLIIMIIYLGAMVLIGILFSRKTTTPVIFIWVDESLVRS